jgi:hypothetical protein
VEGLTFKVSNLGCCLHTWQIVRGLSADRPRGGSQPTVRRVLHEFLSVFHSICSVLRFWLEGVGQTVYTEWPDCPRGTDCLRCLPGPFEFPRRILEVRGAFSDCLSYTHGLSAQPHEPSAWYLHTVYPEHYRLPKSLTL